MYYDGFLMIYIFFAAVVVFVVLLQRTWSEIHKGCNSVRLQEKAQDNISKRAAVEDINCDIDVAEQANIPKFSKLDNIGPLSGFE